MAESNNKNNTNSASPDERTNVLDFTTHKLKQLVKEYRGKGEHAVAIQVEDCLEAYLAGDITIVWRDGLPFIKVKAQKAGEST